MAVVTLSGEVREDVKSTDMGVINSKVAPTRAPRMLSFFIAFSGDIGDQYTQFREYRESQYITTARATPVPIRTPPPSGVSKLDVPQLPAVGVRQVLKGLLSAARGIAGATSDDGG